MSESEKQYCSEQKNVQISSRLSNGPLTAPSYFPQCEKTRNLLSNELHFGETANSINGVDFT